MVAPVLTFHYHMAMKFPERLLDYDAKPLSKSRRSRIAAHVIAINVMQDIAHFLQTNSEPFVYTDSYNPAVKVYATLLDEHEFSSARQRIHDAEINGNLHTAAYQMGIATKRLEDALGNSFFHPNPDHIVATHYLESDEKRQKINASTDVDTLLDDNLTQMHEFYKNQAVENIASLGKDSDLRSLVQHTINDSLFWLDS